MVELSAYYTGLLLNVGTNIILALSLYITFKTGQVSLGHAGFMAIGAYFSAVLTVKFGVPLLLAVLVAGIPSALFGVLIGIPVLRLKGLYLAIATLGFGIIVQIFFENFSYTGASMGFFGMKGTSIALVYAIVLILVYVFWKLDKSRIGRAFEAIKEDEIIAESMGVNTVPLKVASFAIGAAIAGIGGALDAHHSFYIDAHDFGFMRSVTILLFLVFGGAETFIGAIVGATLLTLLPEWLRFLNDYRMIFYGFLLIFLMIFRPQGLIDKKLLMFFKPQRFIEKRLFTKRKLEKN
jgi:branched-chain amino acid transport system permease protein